MDNDSYLMAITRSREQAERFAEGRDEHVASPYQILLESSITLRCPYDRDAATVITKFGVAVGPDDKIYISLGRDGRCFTPISNLDLSCLEDNVSLVAREAVRLIGGGGW